MKQTPTWKQCLAQNLIQKSAVDHASSLQMERMAALREEFLQEHFEDKFLSLKLEAYYDLIRELLHAHMYKQGFTTVYDPLVLVYARHHFHAFKKELKIIEDIFNIRQQLHAHHQTQVKKYLEQNEEKIKRLILELKKRLHK